MTRHDYPAAFYASWSVVDCSNHQASFEQCVISLLNQRITANATLRPVVLLLMVPRLCSWFFIASLLFAQADRVVDAARRYQQAHEREIIASFWSS